MAQAHPRQGLIKKLLLHKGLFIVAMLAGIPFLVVFIIHFLLPNLPGINLNLKGDDKAPLSGLVGLWWIFIFAGVPLFFFAIFYKSERVALAGVILMFIGFILVQVAYVLPLFGGYIDILKGDLSIVDCSRVKPEEILQYASCILAGHAVEAKNIVIGWTVWFVFVFLLPLIILYYLFLEFSDFLKQGAREVVAFAMSLIAYRALMSTLFIEMLSYGAGGIALLAINWLFFGYIRRIVDGMFEEIEKSKRLANVLLAAAQRRRNLYDIFFMKLHRGVQLENAIRAGDVNTVRAIFNEILQYADTILTLGDLEELKKYIKRIEDRLNAQDINGAINELNGLRTWLTT